ALTPPLFPYTTLFRSHHAVGGGGSGHEDRRTRGRGQRNEPGAAQSGSVSHGENAVESNRANRRRAPAAERSATARGVRPVPMRPEPKSTRLNSSHWPS